jgi:hypothetical protein
MFEEKGAQRQTSLEGSSTLFFFFEEIRLIYLASKIVNIDLEVTIKVHALANFRSFTTCKGYVVKLCCLQKQFGLLKRT